MENTARTGWGFWVIVILSLLWNAFGGFDYYMTQSRNPAYMAQFPAEVMSFIDAMPVWAVTAWAIGVWASLLGAILLLIRSRWALTAYAASLLGLAISNGYQFAVGMPDSMMSPAMMVMNLIIWAALIFQLWYAWRCRNRGILR